jgi:glycosyltransferase involved in cell wall biosynthesis
VIDASDTEALTKNIEKILRNPKLAKDLAKKGLEQAKKFTWENSAAKLRDLIEDVGKKP